MRKATARALALTAVVLALGCGGGRGSAPPPPETKVDMVEETLHGMILTDPYRWLEDESSEETKEWVAKQAAYSRRVLDSLPSRDRLSKRLTEVLSTGLLRRPEVSAGRYFYMKKEGTQNQPVVYMREGVSGTDRVLLDPNKMSAEGTTTVDWIAPSKDGKLLAYGMSEGGTETSSLYVLDIESGKNVGEPVPKVRWANVQWLPDRSGFYYSRPRKLEGVGPGEEVYHRRVFRHKLGAGLSGDTLIYGEGLKQEEMPDAFLSSGGRHLLIEVFIAWGKNRLYVKDSRTDRLLTIADDGEFSYTGEIVGDILYLLTNWEAPRYRVFAVNLRKPQRKEWVEIVPEGDAVIEFIKVAGGKLFAGYVKDAHSELAAFSLDGKVRQTVPLPEIGTVAAFEGEWSGNEAFFEFSSFTTPTTVYRLDLRADVTEESALNVWARLESPIDPSQFETRQIFYTSKDGTRIPMYLIRKIGVPQDGSAPGLLYGYGGFNISLTPQFQTEGRFPYIPWIESGGVLAIANLRGGSEYGEDWHRAGMLGNKQNVFDDFIAAAEFLGAEKYVDPNRLAIHGRSNGGLLVGAAMTQRPELFRAVVCGVPLLDMIRYHHFRMARLWISEYGSADIAEDFQWLLAYSPYHNVEDGVAYPATLIYTGESDSRVDPLHARKMAARLQAANSSSSPILLRVDTAAGHGQGKPLTKTVDEWTDIWSFVFDQLGVNY